MTINDFITYFETASANHKAILHNNPDKHFCRVRVQEVLTGMNGGIQYPAVALEIPELDTEDQLSDNIRDDFSGAVLFLYPVEPNDFVGEINAINDAFELAKDFRAKMMNDRRKDVLKNLDPRKFKIVEVGPVYNNLYGARLDFGFDMPANLWLDVSKWNNETAWSI